MGVRCGASARFLVSGSSRPATVGIASRHVPELEICCGAGCRGATSLAIGSALASSFSDKQIAADDQVGQPVRPQPARRAAGRNRAAWTLAETTTFIARL